MNFGYCEACECGGNKLTESECPLKMFRSLLFLYNFSCVSSLVKDCRQLSSNVRDFNIISITQHDSPILFFTQPIELLSSKTYRNAMRSQIERTALSSRIYTNKSPRRAANCDVVCLCKIRQGVRSRAKFGLAKYGTILGR